MAQEIKYWDFSMELICALEEQIKEKQQIIKFEQIKNFHNVLMSLAPNRYGITLGLRGGYINNHIDVAYINIQDEIGTPVLIQKPLAEGEDEDNDWEFRPLYLNQEFRQKFEPVINYLISKDAQQHLLSLVIAVDNEKGPAKNSRDQYSFDYSITTSGWQKSLEFLLGKDKEEFWALQERKSLNDEIPVLNTEKILNIEKKNKL